MLSSHDRIAAVHAVFGSIAALFVIPAALLVGRYGRANPRWWRTHALLNAVGALLVILTFALGMASVGTAGEGTQFSGDEADLHHKLGLAVLIVLLCQCVFGCVAHYIVKPPSSKEDNDDTKSGRPSSALSIRYAHISFGIVTMALLYWCVWNGMHVEWASMSDDHGATPQAVQVLFWLCVLLPVLAYLQRAGSDILSRVEYTRVALA